MGSIILAAGVLLSLGLYWTMDSIDKARAAAQFEYHAAQSFEGLERSLELSTRSLQALAALYSAEPDPQRTTFRRFVSPLLESDPALQAIEWAPRVLDDQRKAIESATRADGYPGFQFTERSSAGDLQPATRRDTYFPVYYMEPLAGNEPALGFDLASNPTRRRALDAAIDSGQITATKRVTLVQERGNQYGFLLFAPVYSWDTQPKTVEERRIELRGLVLGVFRIGNIVNRSLSPSVEKLTELAIYDDSAPGASRLLFPKDGSAQELERIGARLSASRLILVGGRRWRVVATPSARFSHSEQFGLAPLALIVAMLFTMTSWLYYRSTSRHRQRIQQAQDLLRAAVEGISEGFVIYDHDDRLVICNEAYRRYYRKSADAMVEGARFEEILRAGIAHGQYPDAIGREEAWLSERLRHHGENQSAIEQRLEDGRWLLVSERKMSNGGTAGLRVDVTALKSAHAELQQSREDMRREAERSHEIAANLAHAQRIAKIGSFVRDYRTGHVDWSDEIYNILGIPPGTPPDYQRFRSLVHPDDQPLLDRAERAARENLPDPPFEYRILRGAAELRFIHREAEIIRDADGRPLKRIITMMDVTELRRTEQELRASQETLAWAQRTLGIGTIAINLITGEVTRSKLFDEIHGFRDIPHDRPEMITRVRENVHPDDIAAWNRHVATMRTKGHCEPFEFRYIRPDDRRQVWLREESDVVLDGKNIPVAQITTIRDITERRTAELRQQELERQLFHSQKLEALGTLAGGIAHDLNNTLVPILALSEYVAEQQPEDSSERKTLLEIYTAAERARDLVRRILAFSRKQELRKVPTNLTALAHEALQMLRPTIPATIQLDSSLAAVPVITADDGQLQQVIVNLVTNAVQAIGGHRGRIAVSLEIVSDVADHNAQSLVLTVSDTGCGIEKTDLSRIFEPFFTTKVVGEGTGLGLSMVHGIVTSHGGTITVDSTPGVGTTFVILLPTNKPDEDTSLGGPLVAA